MIGCEDISINSVLSMDIFIISMVDPRETFALIFPWAFYDNLYKTDDEFE